MCWYVCVYVERKILSETQACEYCSLSWMQWISCSLHPHLISLLSAPLPYRLPFPPYSLCLSLPPALLLCTSSFGSSSLEHPCCCWCCYKYLLVAVKQQEQQAGQREEQKTRGQDRIRRYRTSKIGDNKMTGSRARKRRRGEERNCLVSYKKKDECFCLFLRSEVCLLTCTRL